MAETPSDSMAPHPAGIGERTAREPPPRGSRTLSAGRAFLGALADDLALLGRRLGQSLQSVKQRTFPAPRLRGRAGTPHRFVIGLVRGFVSVVVLGILSFAGAMIWALHDLPSEKPVGEGNAPSLILEASNGASLGRVGPLRTPDAARTDFPDVLVNAVISIEDRHFYRHWGFDPQGMARALRRNLAAGMVVEGGSTITQQIVKLRILGHKRTLGHKLREALVAIWLDMHRSKDEILTEYLNTVYLGNGVYGMAAAARLYFNKRLSELTLPEAAMLAGLIRSPSRTNPLQNLKAARARAAVVIDAMRETGAIDAQAAEDAKARPAVPHLSEAAVRAGSWFADWIATQAAGVTGSDSASVRLRTTLDPGLQQLAERAIAAMLDREGARRHASQAALVAMRRDGAVVAMVGGRDYQTSQFNRAANAQRQPGSAFKLFVYFAALRNGLTIDDTVDAGPLEIKGWEPENYAGRHYGRVPLAVAFAESINTAAVRLAQQVGLNEVIAAARDLGVTSPLPPVPSLPLGTADMNLLELTAAYAGVAAGKAPIKPWGISRLGVAGQSQLRSMGPPIVATRSLQPYQEPMIELLADVVRHGTGRAAALEGFSAGKTGTAQDYRDAWFIGFNEELIVGVWVGNDDHSPMNRVTGGSLPAAIWKNFMTAATSVVARAEPGERADADAPPPQRRANENAHAQAPPGGQCDYQACASKYQSFRASDCTYQPYGYSGRRVCGQDSPPRTVEFPFSPDWLFQPRPQEQGRGQCNIEACAGTYRSFDPGDCTYRPYDGGPRRLCTK
jgi:penicillin-binding protein 1A